MTSGNYSQINSPDNRDGRDPRVDPKLNKHNERNEWIICGATICDPSEPHVLIRDIGEQEIRKKDKRKYYVNIVRCRPYFYRMSFVKLPVLSRYY